MAKQGICMIGLVSALSVFVAPARGQCELAELTASDAVTGDRFGESVAISGDVAVVGATLRHTGGVSNAGAAYVYRFDGTRWVEEAVLSASDKESQDLFGFSVAIDGDLVVIGVPFKGLRGAVFAGTAYVYRFHPVMMKWVEEAKLTALDASEDAQFGFDVDINGNTILVGAFKDSGAAVKAGAAYVYRFNGTHWIEQTKLTASDAAALDKFGIAVSLRGNLALVGAWWDDPGGSVYVFRFHGGHWIEEGKLTASDAQPGDGFGRSLSLSGNRVLIGAQGNSSGYAYVFRRHAQTWVEEAKLILSSAPLGDLFGRTVSLSGSVALMGGAWRDDACPGDPECNSGAAIIYRRQGRLWNQQADLTASDAAAGDLFGEAVAVDGNVVMIGARFGDGAVWNSGSVYVFDAVGEDCDADLDGERIVGLTDLLILLAAWGPCPDPPDPCPADINDDGSVGVSDLLILLVNWG